MKMKLPSRVMEDEFKQYLAEQTVSGNLTPLSSFDMMSIEIFATFLDKYYLEEQRKTYEGK